MSKDLASIVWSLDDRGEGSAPEFLIVDASPNNELYGADGSLAVDPITGVLYIKTATSPTSWSAVSGGGGSVSPANPTASVGPAAVNGVAATFMRSDAAPALANTAVTPGAYTYASVTVDAQGRLTAAASGTPPVAPPSAANPTASVGPAAVNGVATTFMRSDAAPALANTAVAAGSYTHSAITVDAQGRLTAASSGAAPPAAANPTASVGPAAVNEPPGIARVERRQQHHCGRHRKGRELHADHAA